MVAEEPAGRHTKSSKEGYLSDTTSKQPALTVPATTGMVPRILHLPNGSSRVSSFVKWAVSPRGKDHRSTLSKPEQAAENGPHTQGHRRGGSSTCPHLCRRVAPPTRQACTRSRSNPKNEHENDGHEKKQKEPEEQERLDKSDIREESSVREAFGQGPPALPQLGRHQSVGSEATTTTTAAAATKTTATTLSKLTEDTSSQVSSLSIEPSVGFVLSSLSVERSAEPREAAQPKRPALPVLCMESSLATLPESSPATQQLTIRLSALALALGDGAEDNLDDDDDDDDDEEPSPSSSSSSSFSSSSSSSSSSFSSCIPEPSCSSLPQLFSSSCSSLPEPSFPCLPTLTMDSSMSLSRLNMDSSLSVLSKVSQAASDNGRLRSVSPHTTSYSYTTTLPNFVRLPTLPSSDPSSATGPTSPTSSSSSSSSSSSKKKKRIELAGLSRAESKWLNEWRMRAIGEFAKGSHTSDARSSVGLQRDRFLRSFFHRIERNERALWVPIIKNYFLFTVTQHHWLREAILVSDWPDYLFSTIVAFCDGREYTREELSELMRPLMAVVYELVKHHFSAWESNHVISGAIKRCIANLYRYCPDYLEAESLSRSLFRVAITGMSNSAERYKNDFAHAAWDNLQEFSVLLYEFILYAPIPRTNKKKTIKAAKVNKQGLKARLSFIKEYQITSAILKQEKELRIHYNASGCKDAPLVELMLTLLRDKLKVHQILDHPEGDRAKRRVMARLGKFWRPELELWRCMHLFFTQLPLLGGVTETAAKIVHELVDAMAKRRRLPPKHVASTRHVPSKAQAREIPIDKEQLTKTLLTLVHAIAVASPKTRSRANSAAKARRLSTLEAPHMIPKRKLLSPMVKTRRDAAARRNGVIDGKSPVQRNSPRRGRSNSHRYPQIFSPLGMLPKSLPSPLAAQRSYNTPKFALSPLAMRPKALSPSNAASPLAMRPKAFSRSNSEKQFALSPLAMRSKSLLRLARPSLPPLLAGRPSADLEHSGRSIADSEPDD